MNLTEYFLKQGITLKEFSESIEYSTQYVSSIMKGRMKPGAKFIRDIERATNRQVTREELLRVTKSDSTRCFYCNQSHFPDEAA